MPKKETKPLDGITIFVNSDAARAIAEEAGLHEFCGVIVACLSRREMDAAIAIAEQREMARQLKLRKIVPAACVVRIVGPGLDHEGKAGLVVNYLDA